MKLFQRLQRHLLLLLLVLPFATSSCDSAGRRKMQQLEQQVGQVVKIIDQLHDSTASASSSTAQTSLTVDEDSLLHQQLPDNTPNIYLPHVGHLSAYNPTLRNPNYVAWKLTAERLQGHASRKGVKWQEDPQAPAPRVDTYDFMQSGYDRGHMCPAGDNKWNQQAMNESFFLTNVCPQLPSLNRGDWNEIENWCRDMATKYGEIYIVSGPIFFNKKHKTIGDHRVVVPEAFFKVVLCLQGTPKAIGFICRNEKANRTKEFYVNTVDDVERITKIDFFHALPDAIENKVEASANIEAW